MKPTKLRHLFLAIVFLTINLSLKGQTYTVTSANDFGAGTLREGITLVNQGLYNKIEFNISPTSTLPDTIYLTSKCPAFLTPITIDGTTESGYINGSPAVIIKWKGPISSSYPDSLMGFIDSTTITMSVVNIKGLGFTKFVSSCIRNNDMGYNSQVIKTIIEDCFFYDNPNAITVSNAIIRNCKVDKTYRGIRVWNYSIVENCKVSNITNIGIWARQDGNIVQNNTIDGFIDLSLVDSPQSIFSGAIALGDMGNVNNIIRSNTVTNSTIGITISNILENSVETNNIINCDNGILVTQNFGRRVNFIHNNISGSSRVGLRCRVIVSNCIFDGNKISNCSTGILGEIGVLNNRFINNKIFNNTANGIKFTSSYDVKNNFLSTNYIWGNDSCGVYIEGSPNTNNVFKKNFIGIDTANNVKGNLIGIYSKTPQLIFGSLDSGNVVRGNVQDGILISGTSPNAQIIGNIITSNGGNGIEIQSSGNTIYGNIIGKIGEGNLGVGLLLSGDNNNASNQLYPNTYAANGKDGIVITGQGNSASYGSMLTSAGFKAVNLFNNGNINKTRPQIASHTYNGTTITLSGTCLSDDSILIYQNDGLDQRAIKYIDKILAVGTSWQISIPITSISLNYDYAYFVAQGIDNTNRSSELSDVYKSICLTCPCMVINTNDSGPGSLREAVGCANAKNSHANISFAIPGAGPYTITLAGPPLVTINSKGISVDGNSQVLSSAGTGDQTINIQSGSFILPSICGPSTFTNLKFSNSPSGIFSQTDSLTVSNNIFSQSSLRVYLNASSDSNKVLIEKNSFSGSVFAIDAQNINVLTVRNNSINNNMGGNGINIKGGRNLNIQNNDVISTGGRGFDIENAKEVQIISNKVTGNNSGMGIFLLNIDNGSIKVNKVEKVSSGITFGNLYYSDIKGNVIKNFDTGFETYITSGSRRVTITEDTLISGKTSGMSLAIDTSEVSKCYIDSCISGIHFFINQGGVFNTIVSNNEIYHFQMDGINMGQGYNNVVENNIIGNGSGIGIQVRRPHSKLLIRNNKIGINKSNNQAPILGVGVQCIPSSNLPNVEIFNNSIGNIKYATSDPYSLFGFLKSGNGIVAAFTDTLKVEENNIGVDEFKNIHPIEGKGVFIDGRNYSSAKSIKNNHIENTPIAIDLFNSQNCLVSNNNIKNVNKGINIQKSGTSSVSSNNKLSQNNFVNVQGKLIDLHLTDIDSVGNNGKTFPMVNTLSETSTNVTVSGTSTAGDTVEVYEQTGSIIKSTTYLNYAVADASGNWQAVVAKSTIDTTTSTFFKATATDVSTNTSEFNGSLLLCFKSGLPATQGMCKDDSTLVVAGVKNANSYTWTFQGNTVATSAQFYAKQIGDYQSTVSDVNGCNASGTIKIIENPLPPSAEFLMASEAGITDNVIVVDISFSFPDSLKWDFGAASVRKDGYNYILQFPTEGDYDVKLTSYLGNCHTTTTHSIHIGSQSKGGQSGFVFPYIFKNVTLGPNPNNGIFNINAELATEESLKIDIFNSNGGLVQSKTYTTKALTHTMDYNLTALKPDKYLIRVSAGGDERILRMIKE